MTRGTGLHLAALVLVLAAATGTPAADAPDDDLRVGGLQVRAGLSLRM